jgi:hypothetical protein
MPAWSEVLGDGPIGGEKPLCVPSGLESLHAPLPLAGRLVGVLCAVVQVAVLAMLNPRKDFPLRRTVALELIRDDDPRDILTAFEELAEELLRRLLVPSALHQDIEDIAVLIHRPPEIMALAIYREEDLVNGLVTNDKFCMSRQSQIKLRWSRKPSRFRPRKSRYAPHETAHQGAYHETSVADTSTVSGVGRRGTTVGSSLPASPAMEPTDQAVRHSSSHHVPSSPIGGKS